MYTLTISRVIVALTCGFDNGERGWQCVPCNPATHSRAGQPNTYMRKTVIDDASHETVGLTAYNAYTSNRLMTDVGCVAITQGNGRSPSSGAFP